MKTLIAYATNHGATQKYAELLAERVAGDVTLVNLKQEPNPDLTGFDAVIIGTAIYYGQSQKPAKEFCLRNLEQLKSKRLGLFICSLNFGQVEPIMKAAFPAELQESAVATGTFGGELLIGKLSFAERLLAKAVTKGKGDISQYSEEPIQGFVRAFESSRIQA